MIFLYKVLYTLHLIIESLIYQLLSIYIDIKYVFGILKG